MIIASRIALPKNLSRVSYSARVVLLLCLSPSLPLPVFEASLWPITRHTNERQKRVYLGGACGVPRGWRCLWWADPRSCLRSRVKVGQISPWSPAGAEREKLQTRIRCKRSVVVNPVWFLRPVVFLAKGVVRARPFLSPNEGRGLHWIVVSVCNLPPDHNVELGSSSQERGGAQPAVVWSF